MAARAEQGAAEDQRGAPAADRIDQQAHLHALAGPAGEEADEFAADLVRREDVSGDMDSAAGGEDLGAQGLERVAAMPVAQQADGVAGRDRAFAEAPGELEDLALGGA